MVKTFRKLKSKRGESLIEILIAVLIIALGCMLVATLYTASMNLNIQASRDDDAFYSSASEMEQFLTGGGASTSGKATVTDENNKSYDFTIDIFGNGESAGYKRH